MQKYALIILSFIAVSSSIYAFSIETDPQIILENENREKIIDCLEDVYTLTGTQDMKKKIAFCESLPLLEIWTGKLTPTSSEPPSIKISPDSESMDQFITRINLDMLHSQVCNIQINSPLCKDRQLFDRLYHLTEERLPWKNFYPILLGITNAESSLWLNFAKDRVGGTCTGRNNWGWIKWKKSDSWESIKDQPIPDQYGCYLYKFESIEDYWISKVNTIRYGYKGCIDSPTPVRCMSFAYVGDRNVAEVSWIKNVSIFLQ